ncbi:MAG: hypothetical protein V4508_04750 [Pseudomonadota bacterium]
MNASKFIAAAAVFVAAGTAFAADAPATAAITAAASTGIAASKLNVPVVSISAGRSREEVKAEAIQFVNNYKTAFAVQLEQYKN